MKVYFILLSFLYLMRMFISIRSILGGLLGWSLFSFPNYLYILNHLADMVVFSLCLAGCLDLAFKKRLLNFSPDKWRRTYQATLMVGILNVLLYCYGDRFGAPALIRNPGIFTVIKFFLPYVLFAIPVIVHEHELKKE